MNDYHLVLNGLSVDPIDDIWGAALPIQQILMTNSAECGDRVSSISISEDIVRTESSMKNT